MSGKTQSEPASLTWLASCAVAPDTVSGCDSRTWTALDFNRHWSDDDFPCHYTYSFRSLQRIGYWEAIAQARADTDCSGRFATLWVKVLQDPHPGRRLQEHKPKVAARRLSSGADHPATAVGTASSQAAAEGTPAPEAAVGLPTMVTEWTGRRPPGCSHSKQ